MFHDAFSVCSVAARPMPAAEQKPERREARAQRRRSSRCADILTIGANPALEVYLAGLFEQYDWTISSMPGCEAACAFLEDASAAVTICEELLPDGSWRDVALHLKSIPAPPSLVVVGDDWNLLGEVFGLGGFDALTRPLLDSEVVWSVASAWHEWMTRRETGGGGARCSGG